jgi:hypothetical protein
MHKGAPFENNRTRKPCRIRGDGPVTTMLRQKGRGVERIIRGAPFENNRTRKPCRIRGDGPFTTMLTTMLRQKGLGVERIIGEIHLTQRLRHQSSKGSICWMPRTPATTSRAFQKERGTSCGLGETELRNLLEEPR